MSTHVDFRRQPVPQQLSLSHASMVLPAPLRGLIETENWSFTKPGSAVVLNNWFPTQRGIRLRGGIEFWCQVPDPIEPIVSSFDYIHAGVNRMYASTPSRLFDVTFDVPTLLFDVSNGNFASAQLANAGGDYLIAVNDNGEHALRFDGTDWASLDSSYVGTPSRITGPLGTSVEDGTGLTYVWKYRNRLFFIQGGTMDAWYLPLNAVGGILDLVPLSGAATRGGSLLWGGAWTVDGGDGGVDDKCVFGTTEGELLIFSGSNPGDAQNWRQEGRYDLSRPLGKNANIRVGGDLLVATIDGIVPVSAAMTKDPAALSLSAVSLNVEPMWTRETRTKSVLPWTMHKWDERDAMFVSFPGGTTYDTKACGVINLHTGAWARYTGWDATCFMKLREAMFFGTQDGKIFMADQTGTDDGNIYVATMVGGWEMFQSPPNQITWLQARASFFSRPSEPFEPQITSAVDYTVNIPSPPPVRAITNIYDVWNLGLWDEALWDQVAPKPVVSNTMWTSIGITGFSHAPIVQVSVSQQSKPEVELIAIAATYSRLAVNV